MFPLSLEPYFAMLIYTEIVSKEHIGRASGFAWSLGYIGGLLALGLALILLVQPEIPISQDSLQKTEKI